MSSPPVLASIVGEEVREMGSTSRRLSWAGGGRFFRDLDLLDEYMFSSSAYTADSFVEQWGRVYRFIINSVSRCFKTRNVLQ